VLQWRKYCREIGCDKPLPLDREQKRVRIPGSHGRKRHDFLRSGPGFHRTIPSQTSQPENDPMAALGRLGQFLGLAIPAVAVLLELNHAISLGQMLVMLVAAVCCFWIGRILEGYSRNA
jgi:hypothetical protein